MKLYINLKDNDYAMYDYLKKEFNNKDLISVEDLLSLIDELHFENQQLKQEKNITEFVEYDDYDIIKN